MSQSPLDFLNLLVRPPGDLFFFLGIIIITQAGFFMALERRLHTPDDVGARRYLWAGLGVMMVWTTLMLGALVALVADQDARLILPPLERATQVITALLMGWAFLVADHDRWGRQPNVILLGLVAATMSLYIVSGALWPGMAGRVDFNVSTLGLIWTALGLIVTLGGIALLGRYFNLVVDAPLKLVSFLVMGVGMAVAMFQIAGGTIIGDYLGVTRLAFLAALPILPAVIYRMVVGHLQADVVATAEAASHAVNAARPVAEPAQLVSPLERESVQLLKALGLILEHASPNDIPRQIISAALDTLKADVGLLLRWQDANYVDIFNGYDAVMGRPIAAFSLNLNNQPTLANAIERQSQRGVYVDRNAEELQDLYTRLDIGPTGPAYFQPLMHNKQMVGVLAICLPYTGRELTDGECERLRGIAIISAGLLSLSQQAQDARLRAEERIIEAMIQGLPLDQVDDAVVLAARQEMQASLEAAREQIRELTGQVMQLKLELDSERGRVATALEDTQEGLSISQQMLALNDEQMRLQAERDALQSRLQEAEAALTGATASSNQDVYNAMIEMLRREKEDLMTQRASLQAQLDELRRGGMPTPPQDVLANMSAARAQLELERDQLRDRLDGIEGQLAALGIENGAAGLTRLIGDLHEQRATLQTRYEAVRRERDALLNERAHIEEQVAHEKERDQRIEALQTEIRNLAADREALVKQRDKLRGERDELMAQGEASQDERAQLRQEAESLRTEAESARAAHAKAMSDQRELADQLSAMSSQIYRLEAERRALQAERDQYLARLEGDRDRLQELGTNGVGSLTHIIQELSKQRDDLERELRELRTMLDAVENRADMLQIRLDNAEKTTRSPNDPALIMGLVQELRTPMTSIMGYVELLLAESAGILGEMQRGFLQRVAANINRLASMLEDLTRITALDTGSFELMREPVDVIELIEDAITGSATQFRERGLIVHLNLDDDAPIIEADRDAVNQVIVQLLTNAYLVTPPDREIFVMARREAVSLAREGDGPPIPSLVITVEDRGGGIAQEDELRVFSYKYRAENPLIVGLGDTGVGLAMARALIEAHGGRMWLETRAGLGMAFHFALPLESVGVVEG